MYLNIFTTVGNNIKNFFIELGIDFLTGLVSLSYWVCMFICIVSLIAFLAGFKKSGKWSTLSILIYTTLQAILGAVK